ncbi:hypothetical protein ACROYT_G015103 [Oculina patagonica]
MASEFLSKNGTGVRMIYLNLTFGQSCHPEDDLAPMAEGGYQKMVANDQTDEPTFEKVVKERQELLQRYCRHEVRMQIREVVLMKTMMIMQIREQIPEQEGDQIIIMAMYGDRKQVARPLRDNILQLKMAECSLSLYNLQLKYVYRIELTDDLRNRDLNLPSTKNELCKKKAKEAFFASCKQDNTGTEAGVDEHSLDNGEVSFISLSNSEIEKQAVQLNSEIASWLKYTPGERSRYARPPSAPTASEIKKGPTPKSKFGNDPMHGRRFNHRAEKAATEFIEKLHLAAEEDLGYPSGNEIV